MKASDLLIKALENEGVEYIFGIPGEENLDFLNSLKNSTIKLILTRHEQAAGFMAANYARLTGKVGVCLSTLGPGATNFTTCASYALLGGMPLMFITGQKPIKKSKQGRFQIVDVVAMMKPIVKSAHAIVDANNIPSLVRDGFRIALEEKPGPVHLEFPEDIAAEDVDRSVFAVTKVSVPSANDQTIKLACDMLKAAKMPLVVIASGANRRNTHQKMTEFIDRTHLYFCTTQMGKGVVDESHPHCLGTAALSEKDYVHCAIDRSDLIINIGHDVCEKPPFFMRPYSHQKVLHISFNTAQIDDVYFPDLEVIGCINGNLAKIADALEGQALGDFSYFQSIKDSIEQHVFARSDDNSFPPIPQRIVSDVRGALAKDAILSLDNGMYKLWFARNYKAYGPNTVLLDNALATMGAGLAGAIAAKLVYPQRQAVSICGDGGFMMNSQELETCIRLKLDLVVIVLRDDAYGMIKWKQGSMQFDAYGLDFQNPDFVAYAKSYGAHAHRIEHNGELAISLQKALETGGTHLIEVPIDYSENERVFIEELEQKTCPL